MNHSYSYYKLIMLNNSFRMIFHTAAIAPIQTISRNLLHSLKFLKTYRYIKGNLDSTLRNCKSYLNHSNMVKEISLVTSSQYKLPLPVQSQRSVIVNIPFSLQMALLSCNVMTATLRPSYSSTDKSGFHRSYSTKGRSSNIVNIHTRISSLKAKKRLQRKKRTIDDHSEENAAGFQIGGHHNFQTYDPEFELPDIVIHKPAAREFQIVAYATADEYNLENLADGFRRQGLYTVSSIVRQLQNNSSVSLSSDEFSKQSEPENVLYLNAAYSVTPESRGMYIFRDGVVVFWNIPGLERVNIMRFMQDFEEGPYNDTVIHEEAETLIYTYTDSQTRLKPSQDLILLNEKGPVQLEKFAFSHALAMSVKLGIWEASLDSYIENIEFVTEELSDSGRVPLSQEQVLQRMGQLFALRHLINLSSDLLDTPDFYWEHETLGQLYNRTANHLSIQKRTSVMNIKLGHCVELMDLLKSHLSERHAARLEWIIIILIMIEVFFEILHFM